MKERTEIMNKHMEITEFSLTAPTLERSMAYYQGYLDALEWVIEK